MDPSRKRKIRLVVALGAAVLLAGALIYTSFSAATEAEQPSQSGKDPGRSLRAHRQGRQRLGRATGRRRCASGSATATAPGRRCRSTYTGAVPDPFRDGREVIVEGTLQNGTFVGERDSLVTKCPSKF